MRLPISAGLLLVCVSVLSAQDVSHLYTNATVPPKEVLDRLNLKLAWAGRVPTQGRKDRIASCQLLTGEKNDELLIQTWSGVVQLMDAETGDVKWRTPVGLPYKSVFPAAFNSFSIFVTRGPRTFALARTTGEHRIYVVDNETGLPELGYGLLHAPSAAPIADDAAGFIPSDNRITAYLKPKVTEEQPTLASAHPDEISRLGTLASSPQPRFHKTYILLDGSITKSLVMADESIGFLADDGTFVSLNKFSVEERFRFKTRGIALAAPGSYADTAYVGSADEKVYALDMLSGRLRWRFFARGPITRRPMATNEDLFVIAGDAGLYRVNRNNGREVWNNAEGAFFLAANDKFVYAVDRQRFLLVIDYLKGRTLARYDLRDWLAPCSNIWSDRIYFANHDGQIMCLHHRDYPHPYRPTTPPNKKKPEPTSNE